MKAKKVKRVGAWMVLDMFTYDQGLTEEPEIVSIMHNEQTPRFNQVVIPCVVTYFPPKAKRGRK